MQHTTIHQPCIFASSVTYWAITHYTCTLGGTLATFALPCPNHLTLPCPALPRSLNFALRGPLKLPCSVGHYSLQTPLQNTLITLSPSPYFTWFVAETISSVSRKTPVPAPTLAHADMWYAFYNAINRYGLDKSHVPTIPISVIS